MQKLWLWLALATSSVTLSGYIEATDSPIGWAKSPYWLSIPDDNLSIEPAIPVIGQSVTVQVNDTIAHAEAMVILSEGDGKGRYAVVWSGKSNAEGDFKATFLLDTLMNDVNMNRSLKLVPGQQYLLKVHIDRSRMRAIRQIVL